MKRRKFINIAGSSAIGLSTFPDVLFARGHARILTAGELNGYLRSLVEVDEPSVDKIIAGDPDTVISKVGTAWMPYWQTLKEAREKGVNTMVVHEPTFYTHRDLEETKWDYLAAPSPARELYMEQVAAKKHWIEENGMVIIRCHDVLDKIGGFGIPYAFGRALGFGDADLVRSKTYYNVYKIETRPAIEVAQHIASVLESVGQPGVAFYGDENYPVKTVGLGTGCICNPMEFMDLEMDLAIAIDDSISTWTQTTFAEDTGRPLIVVNHGTTEEFGMKELSVQLSKALRRFETIHFNQGCSYQWVVA
ncbi:MAG: Nif3-like dinuclear metal center hexameric protein [Bacteroidota bacterium]